MDIRYIDVKKYEPIWESWYIKDFIGEGSFGKVYVIERTEFGDTYRSALKHIKIPPNQGEIKSLIADGMTTEEIRDYYRNFVMDIVKEYKLMSRLKGKSNIVSYEDHKCIESEDEISWDVLIRMELLTPLYDYMRSIEVNKRTIIKLGIDICMALELCQKHNVIHRDIKPENIFVSEDGDFKLGDFGIARTMESTVANMSKKGTYTYIAPEVYKGESYGSSVDIYSLGVVMYRLLNNNRAPFVPSYPSPINHIDRENALMKRLSGAPIPPPANAEGRLAEIVLKACAYDPRDRYTSPTQMRMELEAIMYNEYEAKIIYPEGDSSPVPSADYISTKNEGFETKILQESQSYKETAPNLNAFREAELDETRTMGLVENRAMEADKTKTMKHDENRAVDFNETKTLDPDETRTMDFDETRTMDFDETRTMISDEPVEPKPVVNEPVVENVKADEPKTYNSKADDIKEVKAETNSNDVSSLQGSQKNNKLKIGIAVVAAVAIIAVCFGMGKKSDTKSQPQEKQWEDTMQYEQSQPQQTFVQEQSQPQQATATQGKLTVAEMAEARQRLANQPYTLDGNICMGEVGNHLVVLKEDGTVLATGDNRYGQCNVSDWSDITKVYAGDWHTVGLKSDGTVVAAGNNGSGQCNVSDWTDIVKVTAGRFHTVGLKSDGTVVAVGDNNYDKCNVSDWTDIVEISAGYSHTAGLKSNGTVVAVGNGYNGSISGWTDIVEISADTYSIVGLKSDGTVDRIGTDNMDNESWLNIVKVSKGWKYDLALDANGKVFSTEPEVADKLNASGNIVAISAKGADIVFALNDKGEVSYYCDEYTSGKYDLSIINQAKLTK